MVVALDAAFQGLGVWEGFMTPPDFYEVAMDTVRHVRRLEAESWDEAQMARTSGGEPKVFVEVLINSISTRCSTSTF